MKLILRVFSFVLTSEVISFKLLIFVPISGGVFHRFSVFSYRENTENQRL
jgi:Ca2+-dependent lipid-binding protein